MKYQLEREITLQTVKGMFGNYFFPLLSVSKNNFLFLRQKTYLAT